MTEEEKDGFTSEALGRTIEARIGANRVDYYYRTMPVGGDKSISINVARSMIGRNELKHEPYLSMMEQMVNDYDKERKEVVTLGEELEFLRWFYQQCDFGPAHEDVINIYQQEFEKMFGKEVPPSYRREI